MNSTGCYKVRGNWSACRCANCARNISYFMHDCKVHGIKLVHSRACHFTLTFRRLTAFTGDTAVSRNNSIKYNESSVCVTYRRAQKTRWRIFPIKKATLVSVKPQLIRRHNYININTALIRRLFAIWKRLKMKIRVFRNTVLTYCIIHSFSRLFLRCRAILSCITALTFLCFLPDKSSRGFPLLGKSHIVTWFIFSWNKLQIIFCL